MPVSRISETIYLPGSKSECNRALIIQALSTESIEVVPVSAAEDTQILQKLLAQVRSRQDARQNNGIQVEEGHTLSLKSHDKNADSEPLILDVGAAGTVMRFMTAFLTVQNGQFILTGSKRMKERPVKILVEALQSLGAVISYPENEGFPPIFIGNNTPEKSRVRIAGDISSQYISALLMIAPLLKKGLTLEIEGELTSRPYVNMTLQMMKLAGIVYSETTETDNASAISASISIAPQTYRKARLEVEPDWSAASYWFSILALIPEAEILLPGLRHNSLQGDHAIVEIMKPFGVAASFETGGLRLSKCPANFTAEVINLKECPDLAQTVIVCAAALGKNLTFTGLETLRIKETDRIAALQNELAKIGVRLNEAEGLFTLDTAGLNFPGEASFETYHDHRMAMAFAPLATRIAKVNFDNREVIIKSYPAFWKHLELCGFQLQ